MKSVPAQIMLAAAAAIWGGMYVVSRAVMEVIPPWTLLSMRLVLGGGALWVVSRLRGERGDRRHLPLLAGIGALGPGLSIGLQFVGTHLTAASVGALVTSASPAFIALFARWILKEPFAPSHAAGMGAAMLGSALMVGWPAPGAAGGYGGQAFAAGVACLVGAAVTWALYSVLVRLATARYGVSALRTTATATLSGLVVALPGTLWEYGAAAGAVAAGGPGPAGGAGPATGAWTALAAGVLYLALVSTALAFFLWNRGFELLNAASASLFFLLQPLVGAALGVLLLGEPSRRELWLGGLLILLGVAVASHGQRPAASTPRRTAAGGAG